MAVIDISNKGIEGDFRVRAYCLALGINPKKVTKINLSHNKISGILNIKCCSNLQEIHAEVNNIKDINFIKDLKKLKHVNFSCNKISVKPSRELINNLPNIEFLDIRGKTHE